MSYPITQKLIPALPKIAYRNGAYEGVVNHSTDTPEATDEAEQNFESSHWQSAFVHFFVDWDSITQVADTAYIAYGAGPVANQRYVHIELCETKDSAKFKASYDRYVWLTAYLLKQKNLGVVDGQTLVSHAWVTKNLGGTTHTDPIEYLQSHGVTWSQHVTNVKAVYDSFFQAQVVEQEDDTMLDKAIVINSEIDIVFAADISHRLQAPIYFRDGKPSGKVAKEVYIVGGLNDSSLGDTVIFLGGADRYEVAAAVKKFLG